MTPEQAKADARAKRIAAEKLLAEADAEEAPSFLTQPKPAVSKTTQAPVTPVKPAAKPAKSKGPMGVLDAINAVVKIMQGKKH